MLLGPFLSSIVSEFGRRRQSHGVPLIVFGGAYKGLMMLTKKQVTRILREKSPYLAAEYGVKRIGLFGSYAKNLQTEASDIDLVVEFEHPLGFRFIEFTEYIESLLGKSVDILTPAGIQGIRISRIASGIKESITYV